MQGRHRFASGNSYMQKAVLPNPNNEVQNGGFSEYPSPNLSPANERAPTLYRCVLPLTFLLLTWLSQKSTREKVRNKGVIRSRVYPVKELKAALKADCKTRNARRQRPLRVPTSSQALERCDVNTRSTGSPWGRSRTDVTTGRSGSSAIARSSADRRMISTIKLFESSIPEM